MSRRPVVNDAGLEKSAISHWRRRAGSSRSGQGDPAPTQRYNYHIMPDIFVPKRPVITAYPRMPEAFIEAETMSAYLKEKGVDAPHGSLNDEDLRKRVKDHEFDMLIVAGGDGSVLRAGHLCAPLGLPILGVNLGRLGFLIQIDRKEWREYFDKLLNGEAWIENRMMLLAEHIRSGDSLGQWNALNEVVVGRGLTMRPVRLTASVDAINATADLYPRQLVQQRTHSRLADPYCLLNYAIFCWCRSRRTYRLTGLLCYQKVRW